MHLFVPDGFKYFHKVFDSDSLKHRFYYRVIYSYFYFMLIFVSFRIRKNDTNLKQIKPDLLLIQGDF